GWIAAELAVRDTRRLASLTLADAAGIHLPGVAQIDTFLRTDEQRIRDFFHDQTRADEMIARVLRPELEDITMKNRVATARLAWQPRGHDPHLAKWLHRIDVPTLVVWGSDDRLFPKDYAHAYQKLIPGSQAVIIPECGHVPHLEKPQAFVSALHAFIDGMRGRSMKFDPGHQYVIPDVIPGPSAARSPESITPARDYGFRGSRLRRAPE